jgi:hypothetical protein
MEAGLGDQAREYIESDGQDEEMEKTGSDRRKEGRKRARPGGSELVEEKKRKERKERERRREEEEERTADRRWPHPAASSLNSRPLVLPLLPPRILVILICSLPIRSILQPALPIYSLRSWSSFLSQQQHGAIVPLSYSTAISP